MRLLWDSPQQSVILSATELRIRLILKTMLSALNAITVGWPEEFMADVNVRRYVGQRSTPADDHGISSAYLLPLLVASCLRFRIVHHVAVDFKMRT